MRKGHAELFCERSCEYVLANATDMDIMLIPTDVCGLPVSVDLSTPKNIKVRRPFIVNFIKLGLHIQDSRDCARLNVNGVTVNKQAFLRFI